MQFSNNAFKLLYYKIIEKLNQEPEFSTSSFVNTIEMDLAPLVTNIVMDNEKYVMDNWEKKNINFSIYTKMIDSY